MKQQDSFWVWGIGVGALLLAGGGAVYYFQRDHSASPDESALVAPPQIQPADGGPRTVPIAPPQTTRTMPLPALDESDAELQGGLAELLGRDAVARYLVPQRIVRNMVVTIDNLTRPQTAVQQRPIKPTTGEFLVTGADDTLAIGPDNYARYTPLVTIAKAVDAKTLVGMYRGLQPLFQQAYEEVGHPNNFFNTRLLEVIDHLLQTPDVPQPVKLVQPSVQYKFADPTLESLSAGQKLLIRMGPTNAGIIKAKLREIQAELI